MATTARGYPYPVGTDRVMDGDDAIKALATAVDTMLGVAACGTVNVTITAINTPVGVTVTFPAGRFTAAPYVSATPQGSQTSSTSASVSGITATGMTVWGSRNTGTSAMTIHWLAMQQV